MNWRTSKIIGYGIRAKDGSIGSVSDLLFDETNWAVRWAVIDTGTWLPGRKVLLPPEALGRPDSATSEIPVDLTRDRVKDSPNLATDAPVSRQIETQIYSYYEWPPYWGAGYGFPGYVPAAGGAGAAPLPPMGAGVPSDPGATGSEPLVDEQEGDPHLRSCNEVTGYYVEASDGSIGHVEDLFVAEEGWLIRYLLVDTKNWWPGKKVLISPQWLSRISWAEKQVYFDVTREKIKNSPEYDPDADLGPEYEERLHEHYGFPVRPAGRMI